MTRTLTAYEIFEQLEDRLGLCWVQHPVSAEDGPGISASDLSARLALAGFLNLIHPNKVQILGEEELTYLHNLPPARQQYTAELIMQGKPLVVLVGDGKPMPEPIVQAAAGKNVALMHSALPAYELVNYLQYHISRSLARSTTLHGVFMEVFTIGVHIMGDPGCGKSELALELITRGHRLIADDAPLFTQISPEIIDGTCPETLQDCLEVRGLGVLNVRQMFGDAAIKLNKFLRLIIRLEVPGQGEQKPEHDRLRGDNSFQHVLDLDIPCITLQVRAGRNIAVMVEAAVRDFMLKMKGFDAAAAFIDRHARILQQRDGDWGK